MALTRSQLIAGDASKGTVLAGQVQGVKQGDGVTIGPDGTISFNPSTATGVVKLNNPAAFNAYVWPSSQGSSGQYLGIDGQGNLSWSVPPGLVSLGDAPVSPDLGELWFSYDTNLLYVYQDNGGTESWRPTSRGLEPLVSSVSADPVFSGGTGSLSDPFTLGSVTTRSGNTVLFPSVITISNLAPYQYVPIFDNFGQDNGYRFQPTTYFADDTGTLRFKVKFTDYPQTPSNSAYSSLLRIGFDQPFFLELGVGIVAPVNIISSGSISGGSLVGDVLTYTPGLAAGGTPPYTYTWVWKTDLDNSELQSDGFTYVISPEAVGGRVYVQMTATDLSLDFATGNTPAFPAMPTVVERGPFPITNILFPSTATGSVSTLWADAGTTLNANGCIEFSTDGISYGQGPSVIANGGTITTRWISSPSCADTLNSTTITGCVYSNRYQNCGSLVIDKIPSPFTFAPVSGITPGSVATSQDITPIGYNSVAYVTFNGSSTGSTVQASINGGSWVTLSTIGDTSVPISPGSSLRVRMTTGGSFSTDYTAIINIGSGTSVQSATFTATTTLSTSFTTPITFPITTTSEVASSAWLAGDGSTNLSATGCIQFKVGTGGTWTGAGDPAVAITTGDILYTRWSNVTPGTCGGAAHGTPITGTITNVPAGGTKVSTASLTLDRVPSTLAFQDLTNQAKLTVISSNVQNITGTNAPSFITRGTSTLTSLEASIGGGAWTAIPASGETLSINPVESGPGTTLQIRGTTGSSDGTTYTAVINVGQGTFINSDTWGVTTSAITPSIVTPSIVTPVNGAVNINPNSVSPAGITVTSSAYSAINGAGAHTSSDWEVYYLNESTPVYIVQVSSDTSNLTSYFIPAASLTANRTYFARVRYRTNSPSAIASNWSPLSQFSTATTFSLQWVVRAVPGVTGTGAICSASSPTHTLLASSINSLFRTTNGISFEYITGPFGANIFAMTYASSAAYFVAVTPNDANSTSVRISSNNGSTWSTISSSLVGFINAIAYSPSLDLLCMVGRSGIIYTSPANPISWTQRASGITQDLSSVIWDGTAFIACGGTSILRSTNGVSWNLTTVPLASDFRPLNQVAYNSQSGIYYITRGYNSFSTGGSVYGLRSTNGTSWTQVTTPAPLQVVAAGGNWFVAGEADGGIVQVYTSNDASIWTLSYTNSSYSNVRAMTYMPSVDRFVFSSQNWVLTSTT